MAFWMIRAGERGYLVDDFEREGKVAIGWSDAGDFTQVQTLDQMKRVLSRAYPEYAPAALGNAAAMTFKFRELMQKGDRVLTYDPAKREYLLGTVRGDYRYAPGEIPDYNHVRSVDWQGRVSRDSLSTAAKNTLGSTLALFEPGDDVLRQLERALANGPGADDDEAVPPDDDLVRLRHDMADKAHEFIKDQMLGLSPEDMEELVAALLRAMGYRATVTKPGPDRGRDVVASPDGLGLQQPRIAAEVKHRKKQTIGAPEIRSFIGALRKSDSGLYVSTGGFTREAGYEAERASVPVTLIDLDQLAQLVVEHYDQFDSDGRALLPLIRLYWPAF